MGDRERYSSQRRSTDPYRSHRHHDRSDQHHQHQHTQPRYAPAEYTSRRRHTDPKSSDIGLTRVHSRPEDYMNKQKPEKLFSYICFDDQGHPRECDEVESSRSKQPQKPSESRPKSPERKCKGEHVEAKAPLHRVDSYPSNEWARTDDSGDDADSEDELTLPSMYHHDIASRDDEWVSRDKPQARSPERPKRTDRMSRTDVQREQERRRNSPTSTSPRSSAHRQPSHSPSSSSSSRRQSPTSSSSSSHEQPNAPIEGEHSPAAQMLIAKVADHLQAHKGAYNSNGSKQLISELLGEVIRKVQDGGLDSKLMKDVVREVQHVL